MKTERMIGMKPQHTSFLTKPPDPGARLRRLPLAALTLIFVSALSLSGCPGSDSSSDPGDTSPPVFQSAMVIGATLAVTFNETLGNVPSDSPELQMRFLVMVGPAGTAVRRNVNSVSDTISGDSTLELTLAMPVVTGDRVTLAYTAGTALPISDVAGNPLADFGPEDVRNPTPLPGDTDAPVFQSAMVNGDTLAVTFNENLNFPLPAGLEADFTVRVTPTGGTGAARAVDSVSDGTLGDPMIELTLESAVIDTDGVTVEYTADNSRRITDLSGNILASFAAQTIRNNTVAIPTPDDIDGDGVPNAADNCILISNSGQEDDDNDDVGNVCDNCPNDSNPDQVNSDDDAMGNACDPDIDGDDVPNAADNCPNDSNPDQVNSDDDAMGNACDPDIDGDGVPNAADNCPNDFNPDRVNSDDDAMGDACDLDDDGDGLIEIHDLDMLNNVRNNLSGTAYNDGSSDDNTTGCGGLNGITTCSGYELSRDLDFGAADSYADNVINAAWRPTGSDPATATNPGWMPIGDNSDDSDNTRFTATFEGNGYSISSLYVRVEPASGRAFAGLFGYIGSGAGIRNTGVVAAAVFASSSGNDAYAGGLVGQNDVTGSISNSYATGSVSASASVFSSAYAGGLMGVNDRGSISNSYTTGSVSAFASADTADANALAGGLVGFNRGGSISNSYATGSVSSSSFDASAGGLVGFNDGGSISNSYATGSVSAVSSSSSSPSAGGLVGLNDGGSISNSYATGSVSSSSSSAAAFAFAGGLVGWNNGSISNSYATGSVSASASVSGTAEAGGLVGRNDESISNSYATGSVSASASRTYVGGLVGRNSRSISNSYATGPASASASLDADAGGLVGWNDSGSISNSYATGSVSAVSSSSSVLSAADAGGLVGYNDGSISNSYATGSASASSNVGGLVGPNFGSISNSYWDRSTVVLIEDGAIVSAEDQDTGTGDHTGVTALTSRQLRATSGTYPDMLGADFDLGSASEYPLVEYAEVAAYCSDSAHTTQTACQEAFATWRAAETECEVIAANTAANDGDLNMPDCGDLLPGQAVRMASGFLRFSNAAIGTLSSTTDFAFFYDIADATTSIAISGTGVNGTSAGSYAIEDAVGTALAGYSFSATSGNSMITLPTLNAGDEFYLRVTFTKGSDSFTQRYRFKK